MEERRGKVEGKLIYSNLYKHCYNKAKEPTEWTMAFGHVV